MGSDPKGNKNERIYMTSLNLKIEDNLDRQLNAVCNKKGYAKDELVRSLIVNYLGKENPGLTAKLSRANFGSLMTLIETDGDDFAVPKTL